MTSEVNRYPIDGTAEEKALYEAHDLFLGDERALTPGQQAQHFLNLVALQHIREHGGAELPSTFATAILPDYRASAGGPDA